MATVISEFKMKGTEPWIKKDPSSGLIYGVDMKPWLATNPTLVLDASTGPNRLTIRDSAGVTVVGDPFIQDNILCAFVEGFDEAVEKNFVTFHFYCTDGQHDDRTIYFEKREN